MAGSRDVLTSPTLLGTGVGSFWVWQMFKAVFQDSFTWVLWRPSLLGTPLPYVADTFQEDPFPTPGHPDFPLQQFSAGISSSLQAAVKGRV